MEGIKYLLKLIFEAIFCGTVWNLYSKSFIDKSSRWYYKKMIESLKIILYSSCVLLVLKYFKFLNSIGLIKQSNKQLYVTTILLLVLIAVAMVLTAINKKENKKQIY